MEIGQMQLEKPWPHCLPRDLLGTLQHHSGIHLGSSASSHRPDEIAAFPLFLPSLFPGVSAGRGCCPSLPRDRNKGPPGQRVLTPEQARLLPDPPGLPGGQSSSAAAPGAQHPPRHCPEPMDSRQGVLGSARPGKANLILLHPFRECRICKLSS